MQHRMWVGTIFLGIIISTSITTGQQVGPSVDDSKGYTLNVAVDEVSVVFHASDWQGIPMNDLKINDIRITDNRQPPRQVVSFEVHPNLPIRMGVMIDTSMSMLEYLRLNQWIASEYAERFLDKKRDRAFVMRFDSEMKIQPDWTSDVELLTSSIRDVAAYHESRLGGTAIFDALYKACRDQFGTTNNVSSGNFILLFTDGVDNASHARIADDIDICQRANTAIYIFNNEPKSRFATGQKVLQQLADKSGGQMYFDQTPEGIMKDLYQTDVNLRSQYRIVYRPKSIKRDGSFHPIKLESPTRGGLIITRSGYYAPQ
jgi:Ca-activated chloride channel homolog